MSYGQGEPIDFAGVLSQLGQISQSLLHAQEQASERLVEGSSGGGAVRIVVSGGMEFKSVTIDPAVVRPDEVNLLEDLVLVALRDAMDKVGNAAAEALGANSPTDVGSLLGALGLGDALAGSAPAGTSAAEREPVADEPPEVSPGSAGLDRP
jgi:DNA-binding YbaB/EbfC family protein